MTSPFSHFLNVFLYLTIILWFLLDHHLSSLCLPSTCIFANSFESRIPIIHFFLPTNTPGILELCLLALCSLCVLYGSYPDLSQVKVIRLRGGRRRWREGNWIVTIDSQRAAGSWPCHQLLDTISLDIVCHTSFLHAYRQLFPRTERKQNPNVINYFKNSET